MVIESVIGHWWVPFCALSACKKWPLRPLQQFDEPRDVDLRRDVEGGTGRRAVHNPRCPAAVAAVLLAALEALAAVAVLVHDADRACMGVRRVVGGTVGMATNYHQWKTAQLPDPLGGAGEGQWEGSRHC